MTPERHLCGALSVELGRHARLLHVMKSRMHGWVPHGLDGAAFGLLLQLVRLGPQRQGELAETSMLDPSTVSRYVGQLVKAGLVERRADPADGRAVQLAAVRDGETLATEALARREQLIGELIAEWSADDAQALVTLLGRLNDRMEAHRDAPVRPPSATPPTTPLTTR